MSYDTGPEAPRAMIYFDAEPPRIMRYAMLRHRDGTPYQLINAMPGMDLDDFRMHIIIEAQRVYLDVVSEVIDKAKYDEILAFGLATKTKVIEV